MKQLILIFAVAFLASCGGSNDSTTSTETNSAPAKEEQNQPEATAQTTVDPKTDKGIGPVKSVEIGPLDETLAKKGEEIFKKNCTSCHKISKRFVGPALKGVTEKQTPEWIMNMILNPTEMIAKNPTAKQLLAEYSAPMADQNLTEEEARAVYEYLRTKK